MIAVALPINNWAAVFAVLGYVLAWRNEHATISSSALHFRQLKELPQGTPVRLMSDDGLSYDATIDEPDGDGVLVLYSQQVNMTGRVAGRRNFFRCRQDNCQQVQVTRNGDFQGVSPRGQIVIDNPEFLSAVLHEDDIFSYCLQPRENYRVVGDIGRIREEVSTPFTCDGKEGRLQDILRIRNFLRSGQTCCGGITATTAQAIVAPSDSSVVIYESAAAYLRHRGASCSPIELILLSRGERTFNQATIDISTRFTSRLQAELTDIPLDISDGVESIAFLEARGR